MPGRPLSEAGLIEFLNTRIRAVKDAIQSRVNDRKMVFTMMMVKRDHNNRHNPFDHLYPVYDLVLARLDGYTYEIAEIEKELKAWEVSGVTSDLAILFRLQDLERRLSVLPKPDDFSTRPPERIRRVDTAKAFRL